MTTLSSKGNCTARPNTPSYTYKRIRLISSYLATLPFLLSFTSCDQPRHKTDQYYVVGISQIIEHDALDQVREASIKTLQRGGYESGKNLKIIYLNAQGNLSSNMQIAQTLISQKPDVILAISTPSAEALQRSAQAEGIPIVFAAVTDPIAAHLATTLEKPDKNVTGIIDKPSLGKQLHLIRKLVPHTKRIGILYNPGESNSTIMVEEMRSLANKEGFELVEGAITKPADLSLTFHTIRPLVDVLYVPLDNTIVSLMSQLSTLAVQENMPLIAADSGSVRKGALATYGFSYESCGIEAGSYVISLLEGRKPHELPIKSPEKEGIYLNQTTASKLGMSATLTQLGTIMEIYP
ncbi:MAG: ABC transporter substrate-binding protein [Alphaproteobacteria bacterium]|nr:ABC transporter substrate-binding protein [Alphaproteobacteria bacterium]